MIETLIILVIVLIGIALAINLYNYTFNGTDKRVFMTMTFINVFALVLNFIEIVLVSGV